MSGIADVKRSIILWGSKRYCRLWNGKGARGVHPSSSAVRAGCFFSSVGLGVVSEVIPEELNFPRYQDLKFPKYPGFSNFCVSLYAFFRDSDSAETPNKSSKTLINFSILFL